MGSAGLAKGVWRKIHAAEINTATGMARSKPRIRNFTFISGCSALRRGGAEQESSSKAPVLVTRPVLSDYTRNPGERQTPRGDGYRSRGEAEGQVVFDEGGKVDGAKGLAVELGDQPIVGTRGDPDPECHQVEGDPLARFIKVEGVGLAQGFRPAF